MPITVVTRAERPANGDAGPQRRRRRRWPLYVLGAIAGGLVLVIAWVIVGILGTPASDDLPTRAAEWARDNGLGAVVTAGEELQYRMHPPRQGGAPNPALLDQIAAADSPTVGGVAQASAVLLHPSIKPPLKPALPHEGQFAPIGPGTQGRSVQIAYVRPDAVHSSYLAGIAWMSGADRFVLHPGQADPIGSHWSQPATIPRSDWSGLVATFNGGFKMKDARGGYFDHGVTSGTLTKGAASLVITQDGRASVGEWGTDLRMTPAVAYVRQNLRPLIEHGVVAKNLDANVESTWGATIGGHDAVWRSGLGETATGDLVYVMGDALTVTSLADLLHRAGAYNAMQLDINQTWVSFMSYRHRHGTVLPTKMGDFQRPANRYLAPVSRDFVAVYA